MIQLLLFSNYQVWTGSFVSKPPWLSPPLIKTIQEEAYSTNLTFQECPWMTFEVQWNFLSRQGRLYLFLCLKGDCQLKTNQFSGVNNFFPQIYLL